jgi:hypothetical protein
VQRRTLSTTSSTPGGFRYAEKSPPLLIQASGSVSFSTNTTRFGHLPCMAGALAGVYPGCPAAVAVCADVCTQNFRFVRDA